MVCRSSTPTSADRAPTTEENAVAYPSNARPVGPAWPVRYGPGLCRARGLRPNRHAHSCRLVRAVGRSRDHPSPRQAACRPAALCQTAPAGQRRGHRLPGPTRPRSRAVPEAHQWRVDRRARQSDPLRADRRRQIVACLRLGSQGLPRQPLCSLSARVPKLFPELALARGDGRYARILRGLTGVHLLILDDWGLEPLDAGARRDLYEILEERYARRSTILTSQIPVDQMARLHW